MKIPKIAEIQMIIEPEKFCPEKTKIKLWNGYKESLINLS